MVDVSPPPPAPTEPPAEPDAPQEPEEDDADDGEEPQLVEAEISAPFCMEHGVSFGEKTNAKTGNTRWCHKKPDASWCVFDEGQVALAIA